LPHLPAPEPPGAVDYLYAALSTVGAIALAGLALSERVPGSLKKAVGGAVWRVRVLHSGRVGDYVAWITLGMAVFGGVFAVALL
jgi:multicomponent Na+:H+ antiporter subunit D